MASTIVPRGALLTVELATLVAGGVQITAVYAGGPLREDIVVSCGEKSYPTLSAAAAAVPEVVPLEHEE